MWFARKPLLTCKVPSVNCVDDCCNLEVLNVLCTLPCTTCTLVAISNKVILFLPPKLPQLLILPSSIPFPSIAGEAPSGLNLPLQITLLSLRSGILKSPVMLGKDPLVVPP